MGKIDKRRLPDIEWDGQIYSYRGEQTPFEQALSGTNERSLFFVGNGGQGKSAMLFSYWIEHMADSLYVDMRMLNGRDRGNAIREYIKTQYNVTTQNLLKSTVLLLDGANEVPIDLKRMNENGSYLLNEVALLSKEFRVVIGSRSQALTMSDRTHEVQREFSQEDYCYCNVLPLRKEQISSSLLSKTNNPSLLKLLENNAMLSMVEDMTINGIEVFASDEEISAGVLLRKYFDQYLRLKFIKLASLSFMPDKQILEAIYNKDEDIISADIKWDKLCDKLKELAFLNVIPKEEIDNYRSSVSRVGILREQGENYYWSDELYQEYFVIKKYLDFICREWVDAQQYEDDIVNIFYETDNNLYELNYEILRLVGEIITHDKDMWEIISSHKTDNAQYFNIICAMICLVNEYADSEIEIPDIMNGKYDVLDSLLDIDDQTPICIWFGAKMIVGECVAIIPMPTEDGYVGGDTELYMLWRPINQMPLVSKNGAMVLHVEEGESGETRFRIEVNPAIMKEVYDSYCEFWEEDEMDVSALQSFHENYVVDENRRATWKGIYFYSESNILKKLLDKNDFCDICLWYNNKDKSEKIIFEQLVVWRYLKGEYGLITFCCLKPKSVIDGLGEKECLYLVLKDDPMMFTIFPDYTTVFETIVAIPIESIENFNFLGNDYEVIKIKSHL